MMFKDREARRGVTAEESDEERRHRRAASFFLAEDRERRPAAGLPQDVVVIAMAEVLEPETPQPEARKLFSSANQ